MYRVLLGYIMLVVASAGDEDPMMKANFFRKDVSESENVFASFSPPLSSHQLAESLSIDHTSQDIGTDETIERTFQLPFAPFRTERKRRSDQASDEYSPLLYRYYGRSRRRNPSAGSVPFILFGPHVDQWKTVAKELSERGFNVLVCERVKEGRKQNDREEGALLIDDLLGALRWEKAVLVACDEESLLSIDAAFKLAPDKIVGLVLCGDLSFLSKHLSRHKPILASHFSLESFLRERLRCPFAIVTDGNDSLFTSHMQANGEPSLPQIRKVVRGGGIAPYRRRPKIFAWVLTRFVEENLASAPNRLSGRQKDPLSNTSPSFRRSSISDYLSLGSRVVSGRFLAYAILYGCILRIIFYQFEHLRFGVGNISQMIAQGVASLSMIFASPGRAQAHDRDSMDFADESKVPVPGDKDEASDPPEETDTMDSQIESNSGALESNRSPEEENDNKVTDDQEPIRRPQVYLDSMVA